MEKNNKSRIPQLTDSKLKLPINLEQKKTEPAALIIKGNSGQRVSSRSRLKPPTFSSNDPPQTLKRTSKLNQGATTTTITKTPNYTRQKWVPPSRNSNTNRTARGNVKATFVRHAGSATKPAAKNTMTMGKTKRTIRKPASMLGRTRDDGQQRKLELSGKRKNVVASTSRNVRRRETPATYELDNLRDQTAHLKTDLSVAQTTKAVTIANKTSLEVERERLKREHNTQFWEVCQLEHVLACEQSKVANLLDQIAKQRSDYMLMAQEKENLSKNRKDLEGKNNKTDQELDEIAKVLAISNAELNEVSTQLDKKLHVNEALKSSVYQLKARLNNS